MKRNTLIFLVLCGASCTLITASVNGVLKGLFFIQL